MVQYVESTVLMVHMVYVSCIVLSVYFKGVQTLFENSVRPDPWLGLPVYVLFS